MARKRITEIGEESRQRILDAAEELFLELGYEKTTLSAIGQKSGISYGSIPWHFGNKAGLLYSVVDRFIRDASRYPNGETHPEFTPGPAGLDELLDNSTMWNDLPEIRLLHMLDAALDDAPPEMVQSVLDRDLEFQANVLKWVEQTLGPDRSPSFDTAGIMSYYVASIRGIAILHRLGKDQFDHNGAREVLRRSMMLLLDL